VLRAALDGDWTPNVEAVIERIPGIRSRGGLRSTLQRHGYLLPGETLSVCLSRWARTFFPPTDEFDQK
jgi:hypothetical protein